uniref:Uncharacterized protein n=1 Tax=Chelonoidis abingdonii TaxID=106734 RepID=A0A8C0G1J4_CHEAB
MPSSPLPWEFHLPLAPADLLRSGGPAQYVVQEVLAPAQVAGQLAEFQRAFQVQGPLAILQHFDTLYSLLHHFRSVNAAVKEDALELMVKGRCEDPSPIVEGMVRYLLPPCSFMMI